MSGPRDPSEPCDGAGEEAVVDVQGAQLEPEEMAALTAVLAQLRAQEVQAAAQRPGRRGPRSARPDRTLLRRGDLGLWARPGRDQWRRSAGPS